MFKKLNIKSTLISGTIAGLLFSIPVYIYIQFASFRESWLLYTGSFLFVIVIWIHTIRDNKQRAQNESTVSLIFNSLMATLAGIIFSCLTCFILLVVLIPGYLDNGTPAKVMTFEPVNIIKDKTDGLSFLVFMAATVVNFCVGLFAGMVLPFYTKQNQTRDTREPVPLHEHGMK